MKRITNIFNNRYIRFILILSLGIFAGWLLFHSAGREEAGNRKAAGREETGSTKAAGTAVGEEQSTVWTCSMHPQIRMDEPGKCPICGMDLIPLAQGGTLHLHSDAIRMTEEAARLADVHTSVVSGTKPVKVIRLYGKVQADERQLQSQVSHLSGRVEKLLVSFTGETIERGQTLAQIYSPELITAQQELLEAAKTRERHPAIYEAAREKLRQWKLTDAQIDETEQSGRPATVTDIVSNTTGVVMERMVNEGDYLSRGSVLYRIADLSQVWVLFDAYESDLQFLRKGETVQFTLRAYPGSKFTGKIAFIDPVIDPVTRVARVRVEADNRTGRLKPEMFATGVIEATLPGDGSELVIPRSALLWTGTRSVVYVKQPDSDEPVFMMREVTLGPSLADGWLVTEGLAEGEEIVTMGTFMVDAAAQLEGKPSMMNPGTESHGTAMSTTADTKVSPDVIHAHFRVEGLCEMCKERIETTAAKVTGVESALWDMESKILHLNYNSSKTTPDKILKAVADAGHDNEMYKAPDDVYNSLPECCLYRAGE